MRQRNNVLESGKLDENASIFFLSDPEGEPLGRVFRLQQDDLWYAKVGEVVAGSGIPTRLAAKARFYAALQEMGSPHAMALPIDCQIAAVEEDLQGRRLRGINDDHTRALDAALATLRAA